VVRRSRMRQSRPGEEPEDGESCGTVRCRANAVRYGTVRCDFGDVEDLRQRKACAASRGSNSGQAPTVRSPRSCPALRCSALLCAALLCSALIRSLGLSRLARPRAGTRTAEGSQDEGGLQIDKRTESREELVATRKRYRM
jgi:hypothetical protein